MEFQQNAERMRDAPAEIGARDEFARELAHRLGNLLQVVNGNLELIAARIEDEQLSGYVRNATAAAGELTELARRLADETDKG